MFISLEELELHRIVISKSYAEGSLDYHGADFKQEGPLQVDAIAELVGDEIRIRGHISTQVQAACDRCLGPVEIPVERDFNLFYRPVSSIAREEDIEIGDDELDVGFYSGNGIPLADVATEQVILAFPMKVVCKADCLGLCPICGANRNRQRCGCSESRTDSPFSYLIGG